jgi:murein DD-endopeptidase MepM/ murein hydrolase activator NlpD
MSARAASVAPLATALRVFSLVSVSLLVAACGAGSPASTPSAAQTSAQRSTQTAGSPTASTSAAGSVDDSPSAAASSPVPARYVFPVRSNSVKYGRVHHDYPATDIFARCGSDVVAPTAGRITEISRTDDWTSRTDDGADRGGLSFSLVGADGVRYYGSHLRRIASSVTVGRRVGAGTILGQVGNTGDARGIACHLHFGISPVCGGSGDWWIRRGVISPYPFLKSWQANGAHAPVATVVAWKAKHGCPKTPTVDR